MTRTHSLTLIVAFAVMLLTGCDSKYPAVSGKVTINGKPVEGVSVLFVPVSTKQNPFPGPFAKGTTNAEGKYSLVTRDGDVGGTVGPNVVEFYIGRAVEVDYMKSNAAILISQAGAKSDPAYKEGQQMLAEAKKIEGISTGNPLKPGVVAEFEVPPEGSAAADFELSEWTGS